MINSGQVIIEIYTKMETILAILHNLIKVEFLLGNIIEMVNCQIHRILTK
jgi:hypothetical protein